MTNDQIKEIALANGHALFTMPDGTEDIHPHVYDFARALIDERDRGITPIKSLFCLDGTILGE